MFIDALGTVYVGEMRIGDREATAEEVGAWEISRAPTKDQRTTERAQQAGYASKGHLYDAIENARFRAATKLGITEEQAHLLGIQHNTMYQIVWAAWEDILEIEAEP